MHKILVVSSLILLSLPQLHAGTLSGVTLPETVQAGSQTLVLNGLGLRTKFMVKVYVGGLYLPQKSSDPTAILKPDTPKRIVMHFVRDVSKDQLPDGFTEAFDANTPDAKKTLKPDIDRFLGALDAVKDGDEIVITYVPATGTAVTLAGKEKLTIAGPDFAKVIFSVWLGPKPPNAGLKKGILGQ